MIVVSTTWYVVGPSEFNWSREIYISGYIIPVYGIVQMKAWNALLERCHNYDAWHTKRCIMLIVTGGNWFKQVGVELGWMRVSDAGGVLQKGKVNQ